MSRFNHSCNPNCDYSWRRREDEMVGEFAKEQLNEEMAQTPVVFCGKSISKPPRNHLECVKTPKHKKCQSTLQEVMDIYAQTKIRIGQELCIPYIEIWPVSVSTRLVLLVDFLIFVYKLGPLLEMNLHIWYVLKGLKPIKYRISWFRSGTLQYLGTGPVLLGGFGFPLVCV